MSVALYVVALIACQAFPLCVYRETRSRALAAVWWVIVNAPLLTAFALLAHQEVA